MWRAVAVIVLGGAALGVGYNAAGLMSRPPRGIPWLATGEEVPALESLAAPGAVAPPGSAAPESAAVARDPSVPAPGAPPPTPAPAGKAPATGATAAAKSRAQQPAPPPAPAAEGGTRAPEPGPAPGEPTTTPPPATPPPDVRQAAPVPFIPELDRPFQIKLSTAKALFDAKAALFLDARDPSEFEAGHIPGAIRLTRDEALGDPDRVKALGAATRPIVAYCEGGTCESSLDLARVLVDAGYRKVLVFSGGFPEWSAAGHPVERGSGGP